MAGRGYVKQQVTASQYTEKQVRNILKALNIKIGSDTYNDFLCYCPIHGNSHTPSFSVSKRTGRYICFNPSCSVTGILDDLVRTLTGRSEFETLRFIASHLDDEPAEFEDELTKLLMDEPEFVEWDIPTLKKLRAEYVESQEAQDYMTSRGFTKETTDHFEIGYSGKQKMVTVPVHSPDGIPVGIVGRGIHDKMFKNSSKLPTSRTFFNLHRAKRMSTTVIVVEASFDCMRVHQAGFPNVVANLGGHMSPRKLDLLAKMFTRVIIMTDFDKLQYRKTCKPCYPSECKGHNAGRDLGQHIADELGNVEILWASVGLKQVYPHGAKDPGEMTDQEIAQAITNAVSNVEYSSWNLY